MKITCFVALLITCIPPCFADQSPGVTRFETVAEGRVNPLVLSIWYPAEGGSPEEIGGNAVFRGPLARPDGPISGGPFPLAMVSHGGLRSADDSGAWLSSALAHAGYIAVEINGPRPVAAKDAVNEVWRRPDDVSHALESILSSQDWTKHIDHSRVSVVGFALGGTAALMLAGNEFEVQRYIRSCDELSNSNPDCAWYAAQNVSLDTVDRGQLTKSRRDLRIASVIAINPEYTDALSEGMTSIKVPALLISLGNDGRPSGSSQPDVVTEMIIPETNAFDGFPVCTEAGPEILSEEEGAPALCGVSTEVRRRAHNAITHQITSFLAAGVNENQSE